MTCSWNIWNDWLAMLRVYCLMTSSRSGDAAYCALLIAPCGKNLLRSTSSKYSCCTLRLYMLLKQRIAELKTHRKEAVMKTCTQEDYAEQEQRRNSTLSGYSIQELETHLLASGKNYAFEFLRNFRDHKGGLLAQIRSAVSHRAKSQNATSGKLSCAAEEKTEVSSNSFLDDGRQLKALKEKAFCENSRKYSWFKKRRVKIPMTESYHKQNWKLSIHGAKT
eukprot:TRINITY_DN12741_c0_g3_i1.p1 TRINITY_DN12741_c0_g3~~TRINITY_DN12741_c0_g3_i1.p1  ORF type:complete len:221 (+),score=24.59 TRINITY_DN12741_c0_g3_i1:223-885(+)